MAAPSKPWESAALNLRSSLPHSINGNSTGLFSSSPIGNFGSSVPVGQQAAPPIPSRIGTVANRQPYGGMVGSGYGYGTSYGGYGSSSYGSYGGYGSGYGSGMYGMGGYGMGGYGMGGYGSRGYGGYGMNPQQPMNSLESRFVQMAEENSRPAFESIESLVHAFGSVSFMMESTFNAIYSSFRAVLGVAENFGRLRTVFGQVFQTFAVLRMFQWMYRKLLFYLGMRHDNPSREAIWKEATGELDPKTKKTVWPMAMFLCLVCAGPYLVWRLLRSLNLGGSSSPDRACDPRTWIDTNGRMAVAVAMFDFNAAQGNELTVKRKQGLFVAPQHLQPPNRDWVLVTHNWKQVGLVPANYIQLVDQRTGKEMMVPVREDGELPEPPSNLDAFEPLFLQQETLFQETPNLVAQPPEASSLSLDSPPKPSTSPVPSTPVPDENQQCIASSSLQVASHEPKPELEISEQK